MTCFVFGKLMSLMTFSTNDDFPHRLGEMMVVLIPFSKLLLSFSDSSFRSVNERSLTVVPYIRVNLSCAENFFT